MLSLWRNSWERRAFRKMRSSAAMMKGGRRAVFCYGQRVWSKRIEFRRALTLLVEASAGECRIAKGSTTTRQARMQAYLGQASWQLRLVQHFGLKFCERASDCCTVARRGRAACDEERSRRAGWRASVHVLSVPVFCTDACPSPPPQTTVWSTQAVGQRSRHAFA